MPWSEHQAVTINNYVRKETLAISRKKIFLGWLFDMGLVSYDWEGELYQWPVRYKRGVMNGVGDGDTHSFSRYQKRKPAKLPLRAYAQNESINKFDRQINKGDAAIVKLWANKVEEMMDDIRFHFNRKLIQIDGYASGNEKEIMGLESVFGAGAALANNKGLTPSDTYATLNTNLGSYGGSWTGNYPDGQGDTQYDFWAPLIVDADGSGWTSSTKTFAANVAEQLTYMILNTERNGYTLDVIMLAKDFFSDYRAAQESKERVMVQRSATPKGPEVAVGFNRHEANFDGIPIKWETDCTAATGYGLCSEQIELKSSQPQLFVAENDKDIETDSERIKLDFYGNLILKSPRCLSKIID